MHVTPEKFADRICSQINSVLRVRALKGKDGSVRERLCSKELNSINFKLTNRKKMTPVAYKPGPRPGGGLRQASLKDVIVRVMIAVQILACAFYGARAGTSHQRVRKSLETLERVQPLSSGLTTASSDACVLIRKAGSASNALCSQHTTSSFPFLGHDVFMDACHHIYAPGQPLQLMSPSLVFLHPREIGRFGRDVVDALQHNVVLVSNSNVDECLPYRSSDDEPSLHAAYTRILASPRVRAWYGPNIVEWHPKLKPLPLGGKWNWRIAEHHGEDENKGRILSVLAALDAHDPETNFRLPDKPNLLFTQMDPSTSDGATYAPTRGHRRAALNAAEKITQAVPVQPPPPHNKTCVNNAAFAHVDRLEEYLRDMRTYKFVLSPLGNGLDTHRTWEALLMGAIPIVETSAMDPLFEGLPVLILNSWQELTLDTLENAYNRFQQRQAYCWGKLFAPYYLRSMMQDLLQI
jgi:hypothetical protein